MKKNFSTGREDVHPQNGLNGFILNWCIGGCWFTPAYTFYNWPIQVKGGGRPYCKQNNRCSLLQIAVVSHKYRGFAVDELRVASLSWKKHGGWPARIWFSDDRPAFPRDKRGMKGSESLDSVASVVNVGNFVTRFKLHLATTTDQGAAGPSPASGLPLLLA